jgi:hypothetical protein
VEEALGDDSTDSSVEEASVIGPGDVAVVDSTGVQLDENIDDTKLQGVFVIGGILGEGLR